MFSGKLLRDAVVGLLDVMLEQVSNAFVDCGVGITASFEELVALCNEELRVIWHRSLLMYCQNWLNPPVVRKLIQFTSV